LPLVFLCSMKPTARMAVVTDASHHHDPMSAVFDRLSGVSFNVDGTTVKFIHARLDEHGAKDWLAALNSFNESSP
jgi:hypothetical protein